MNYVLHILVMIEIYLILGLSLNLLLGYGGLFSLAHAAFYGVGAYISALLMVNFGFNFFLALPVAVIGCMLLALLVALPSLRLKGDYFMLATLAFQTLVFTILYNWVPVTRGPYGVSGIPQPQLAGFKVAEVWQFAILGAVFAAAAVALFRKLYASPYGRVLKAIRDDELLAVSLGKNTTRFKVTAFMISGGVAALPGALFAAYVSYIDPTSFTLDESIFVVTLIVVGGAGNLKGPIIGAFIVLLIPECLRFLNIPDTVAPNVRQIIYGALIVMMMRLRPRGIMGDYGFD